MFTDNPKDDVIDLYVADAEEYKATRDTGPIPVKSIRLHGIELRTVMSRMKGYAHMQWKFKGLHDIPFEVVEQTDFPDPDLLQEG